MKLLNYAKHVASLVDPLIIRLLEGAPEELREASAHLIKAGGKRLRPALLLLAARVAGGDEELALPAAAAVELLHNFTLIHDDIIDEDEFRRGVPTVHKLWGTAMAILAGDYLYSKAYEALLGLEGLGVPYERIVKATRILTWAATTIAEGQTLDIIFEERDVVTEEEYIKMVEGKTAALFKASLEIGAIIGGGDEKTVRLLGEYGRSLGIAFQIQDDVLGVTADEGGLGKPVYSDIREGKRTIIVVHALKNAGEEERAKILSVLGRRDASVEELREVAEILARLGSIDYARSRARAYAQEALECLEKVMSADVEALEMLKEAAMFVISRTF